VGGATDLELFLFGGARVDLSAARAALQEMQENRCFYCGSLMRQDPHVDHFIPWSRYPRDLAQNFVLAHGACNLDKGDRSWRDSWTINPRRCRWRAGPTARPRPRRRSFG